jgi:hypothetical protein
MLIADLGSSSTARAAVVMKTESNGCACGLRENDARSRPRAVRCLSPQIARSINVFSIRTSLLKSV